MQKVIGERLKFIGFWLMASGFCSKAASLLVHGSWLGWWSRLKAKVER